METTPPLKNRLTLKDIADELGVSTMTVSKSLRGIGRISEETRRLVREKAEEIGYFSSRERLFPLLAKMLGGGEHRMRLLCPTVGDLDRGDSRVYRNDMIVGLECALQHQNGDLLTRSFTALDDLLAALDKELIHCVVLSEPYPSDWVEAISKRSPVVYACGHDFQLGVDAVYYNESRAAALAADKLHEAGHRHIAWLGILDRHAPFLEPDEAFSPDKTADWLSHSTHGTRYAAWLYLANQHPGLVNWPVKFVDRDWKTCSLTDAVRQGCREIFNLQPRPTAIVCVGISVARELILQLEQSGLRVPKDVSIAVYGAEEQSSTENVLQISGLSMPMDKVGNLIPEVVQRRLAYPEGLPLSLQLDASWFPGETIHQLLT